MTWSTVDFIYAVGLSAAALVANSQTTIEMQAAITLL
jgi:hypothetical protein